MPASKSINILIFVTTLYLVAFPTLAEGGISIQGTRVIYHQGARQESISLRNSSATNSFLVQSWIENSQGKNTHDFIVTPPLYLSGPKNENILRLILTAPELPKDRESLYYFVAKAIPSIDSKDEKDKSVIRIAAASRIKLFVRPTGLVPTPSKAPAELKFSLIGRQIEITNPTPYYITMTDIKNNGISVSGIMAPPLGKVRINAASDGLNKLTFSTINDSGAITSPVTVIVH